MVNGLNVASLNKKTDNDEQYQCQYGNGSHADGNRGKSVGKTTGRVKDHFDFRAVQHRAQYAQGGGNGGKNKGCFFHGITFQKREYRCSVRTGPALVFRIF